MPRSAVTKSIDVLVKGAGGGGKYDKAKRLGIPIWNVNSYIHVQNQEKITNVLRRRNSLDI